MSRSIADSVSILSETLGNCKTNLKDKKVENVDNIKISDVDEKIAEIEAGGGEAKLPFKVSKVTVKTNKGTYTSTTDGEAIDIDFSEIVQSITVEFDTEVDGNRLVCIYVKRTASKGYEVSNEWSKLKIHEFTNLSYDVQNVPSFIVLYRCDDFTYQICFNVKINATGDF